MHWPGDSVKFLGQPHDHCVRRVAQYRAYHKRTGYSDLAYNLVVCPHGNILQGRGVNVRSGANGNHELNIKYGAVLWLLGAGERGTDPQIAAAVRAAKLVAPSAPTTYKAHSAVRPGGTACPGPWVTTWVGSPHIGTPSEGLSMADAASLAAQNRDIAERVNRLAAEVAGVKARTDRYLDSKNSTNLALLRELLARDVVELVDAGSGLTVDQITDAVDAGVRRALGSLDD